MIKKFLIFSLLLTGCYDYQEVSNLAVVVALAVDVGNKQDFQVNLQILHPYESDVEGNVILVSGEGDNMSSALKNIEKQLMLEVFLGHLQLIVISNDIANIKPIISYLINDTISAKNASIVTCDNSKEFLQAMQKDYLVPAIKIKQLLQGQESNGVIDISLDQFLYLTKAIGIDPILPHAIIVAENEEKKIVLDGMAIYRDYSFVSLLNEEQTIFIALMQGINSDYLLPFENHLVSGAFLNQKYHLSSKSYLQENQLIIEKKLDFKVKLVDLLIDQENYINQAMEQAKIQLRQFLFDAIDVYTQQSFDPLGIERFFYLYNYNSWCQIDNFAGKIEKAAWNIEIDIEVSKTGAIGDE